MTDSYIILYWQDSKDNNGFTGGPSRSGVVVEGRPDRRKTLDQEFTGCDK